MKKSICLEMIYSEVDFYERFGLAKKDGFEFVEFWSWEDKNLKRIKPFYWKLKSLPDSVGGSGILEITHGHSHKIG